MRTATFAPDAAFLLPLPDGAAGALARPVDERGEGAHVTGAGPPAFGVARVGRYTHRQASAGAAGPATRSPGFPGGSSPRVRECACSPTRPTRPQTRSTPPSATSQ